MQAIVLQRYFIILAPGPNLFYHLNLANEKITH